WVDGVYLSRDNLWDIGDTLLATVAHTGGLAANATYSGLSTPAMPGVLPGNYRILVRADVANQEKEGTGETNNVIATALLPLAVRPLPADGTSLSGTVTPADPSDYYVVHLDAGEELRVRLDAQSSSLSPELYVRYAAIPTRLAYDERSATAGTHQEIALTGI